MPLTPSRVCACALAAAASAATVHAQAVEFRVVELTGQTVATPSDPVLDFAIQVRVTSPTGTVGLGGASIAMVMTGEAESRGQLARLRTSNADGTYYTGTPATTGTYAGLAQQYRYSAGINPTFNGVINQSVVSWAQTSFQDIGMILSNATGQSLLSTPGVDTDLDGVPDTAVGSGGTLPQSIMAEYFGANQFVDMYRFRYTVTDLTPRNLHLHLLTTDNATSTDPLPVVELFNRLRYANGLWGADFTSVSATSRAVIDLDLSVAPAPGVASIALPLAGLAAVRRRRR